MIETRARYMNYHLGFSVNEDLPFVQFYAGGSDGSTLRSVIGRIHVEDAERLRDALTDILGEQCARVAKSKKKLAGLAKR